MPPKMDTAELTSPPELSNFERKIAALEKKFLETSSPEEKYRLLMDLGKKIPPLNPEYKTEGNLVSGCQSKLYLHAEKKEGKIFFTAETDALISAGLAAVLIHIYSEEIIETILTKPPLFLQNLGIHASLSPNRSNGIFYIYLKMKQLSVKLLRH